MTEKRFLNFIITEGLLLLILGLCMLIIPKISLISFGVMICFSFLIYGGFKAIIAFMTRNFSRHYILEIIEGIILAVTGIILFFAPAFEISQIIALCGVYFILKSISSFAFSNQTRKTLNYWWMFILVSIPEFLFGMSVIIMIPSAALWLVGIIAGIDFIFNGIVLINMYISTKYIQG